jgi:hypothetical protein
MVGLSEKCAVQLFTQRLFLFSILSTWDSVGGKGHKETYIKQVRSVHGFVCGLAWVKS